MNVEEYVKARAKSDAAFAALILAIQELERRMAKAAATAIGSLDTTGGVLVNSDANINGALRVIDAMKAELAGDPWFNAVSDYLESLDETAERIIKYGVKLGDIDEAPIRGITRNYKMLLGDLLTDANTHASTLWIPTYQTVTGAITGPDGTVASAVEAVTTLTTGDDDTLGRIESELSRPVGDARMVQERASTQVIAQQLDVQFYFYQGSEIDTTREFCADRNDKAWHIKEIESWASLDWDGKKPETNKGNIIELLGGYECRHVMLPIAKRDVPAVDLERMRSKGYI